MTQPLLPFFTYFGGKYRAAPRYPEPAHDLIVEREGVFKECVEAIRMAKILGYQVATNTTVYKETDVKEIEHAAAGEVVHK